jgi:uncharacterized protein
MKRKAEVRLQKWIHSKNRKPLIIRGARQVGKSTLVRQFAETNNLILHEINLERHTRLIDVFKSFDTKRILEELAFIIRKGSVLEKGGILFLDEIQAVPPAIQALRYFYEDYPDLPVVAAGSLLEIVLSKHSFSMPVGRIEYLFLNPMTFEEVLKAQKQDDLLTLVQEYKLDRPFPESAHTRLLDLQRNYFIIGGMPEAVDQFIDTNSFEEASEVHAAILETYRDDFAKYATQSSLLRLHKILDYVPGAVGEKFKYVSIDHREQARELKKALDLLVKARLIYLTYHSDASGLPLKASINWKVFKPFFLDCGLMNFICGVRNISSEQLTHRKFINEGKIAEQFIAQHLIAIEKSNISPELFYWLREAKSANAEVDFVMQSGQEILPIEVKSGQSGTLKSLHQFAYRKNATRAVRFDLNKPTTQTVQTIVRTKDKSVEAKFDLLSLPLYLIEQVNRLI